MESQELDNIPASKGDIERVLKRIETIMPSTDVPANPVLADLCKRLAVIERVSKAAVGVGLADIPIDAETAAVIKGVAQWGLIPRPLGRLNWGCGGFVPPHTQRFQGEILDTPRLAAGRFITGLAVPTVRQYGAYQHIDTIKIGKKLQYSLKGCIRLVKKGTREAVIECTTDMTRFRRKKRKQP